MKDDIEFGKEISIQELTKDDLQGYEYALIYRSEGIVLHRTAEIDTSALLDTVSYAADSNLEVRLFDESGELHLYTDYGGVKAVQTVFNSKQYVDEKYVIDPHFKIKGAGKLIVRRLLGYDEDGQAYVKQTCLAGVEV